jgi:ribosomal protein S12 methylthiotransferase
MGVFTYSEEEGTKAAAFNDEIAQTVKDERAAELMELQQQISQEINEARIGKTYKILVDGKEGEFYIGRTEYDSPEIDNEVLIQANDKKLKTGQFYNIQITMADAFDIFGRVKD